MKQRARRLRPESGDTHNYDLHHQRYSVYWNHSLSEHDNR